MVRTEQCAQIARGAARSSGKRIGASILITFTDVAYIVYRCKKCKGNKTVKEKTEKPKKSAGKAKTRKNTKDSKTSAQRTSDGLPRRSLAYSLIFSVLKSSGSNGSASSRDEVQETP